MDESNLNMRRCRWLDVVKAYDCEILYHHGEANVVADALSCKAASTPFIDLCLRMVIVSPLLDMIKKVQVEGLKRQN